MVTTGAIIHGECIEQLRFNDLVEHPVAVQLGGSDPKDLAACAKICDAMGYDEINLNVGCPSERVQKGAFGACLMKEPTLVSECIEAMQEVTTLPVTVKCGLEYSALIPLLSSGINAEYCDPAAGNRNAGYQSHCKVLRMNKSAIREA